MRVSTCCEASGGNVQPRAADENAYLRSHSWDEYAAWHLALTEGASDETKAPSLPPMSVANAKRALYLAADTNLPAAFEIEKMAWTEVMQSDDAQLALKTFLAVDPDSRRGGCPACRGISAAVR